MWGRYFADLGYGYCNGGTFGSGNWFIGWLFPLLFWGAIILSLIWLARQISSKKHDQINDSAVELVRKRYAAGEISSQEFDEMTAKLS